MGFFEGLKNTALDFVKTPFAQQLAFGSPSQPAAPATAPAAAPASSGLPSWLLPVGLGGAVLVVLLLMFRK